MIGRNVLATALAEIDRREGTAKARIAQTQDEHLRWKRMDAMVADLARWHQIAHVVADYTTYLNRIGDRADVINAPWPDTERDWAAMIETATRTARAALERADRSEFDPDTARQLCALRDWLNFTAKGARIVVPQEQGVAA